MPIQLSHKQWETWQILDRPEIVDVFAGGGAGGGKSWLGCLRQIYRRTKYADTMGFIGRRDFTALRDSTMKTYFAILKQMGYQSGVHYRFNAQEHTIYFTNGSQQNFRHMAYQPSDPDYSTLFGSTEYTDAFIDEAPEVTLRAAQVLGARLRYNHRKHGITPELLLTGNPTDNWIKSRYVMAENGDMIDLPPHRARVLFTIADNPDTVLRDSYTKTLELLDDYDRARLLHGDWTARPNIERPFLTQLNPECHFAKCEYDRSKPLFISFDFNLDPFAIIYSHIWQDKYGWHFHTFDEDTIPSGTIDEGCARIKAKFGNHVMTAMITGDKNGNNRTMNRRDNLSAYGIIQQLLQLQPVQFDMPPNPTHANSREDCNSILRHMTDLVVGEKCVNLRRDMRTVEIDNEGHIKKSDRSKTAQRADHLDAWRYQVNCRILKDWKKTLR